MSSLQDPDVPTSEKVEMVISGLENGDSLEQLIAEFEYTSSSVLQEVIEELVLSEKVPTEQKYRLLSVLYSARTEMSPDGTARLEKLIAAYIPVNSVLEFETVRWLFSFGHGLNHLNRLYKYLGNQNLQDLNKYNQLVALRQAYPKEIMAGVAFMLSSVPIGSRCRIMCSQYVFENKGDTNGIAEKLLEIAENTSEDYNVRADAADALHHYTEGKTQERALGILRELGGNSANIYENKQNVHDVDISEGLALIGDIAPKKKYGDIAKLITKEDKDPKIASSLGRIVMDTARYGKKGVAHVTYSAEEIMERIWEYIQTQEDTETRLSLHKRLIEELRDMADTCSSGHALRLINSLSGFGANVKISFTDQIASSFGGRIEARLRNLDDEELKAEIYLDMVDKGPAFMKFFLNTYPLVVSELYTEYVDGGYVSVDDFDVGITKAMKPYEGKVTGSKVKVEFKMVKRDD